MTRYRLFIPAALLSALAFAGVGCWYPSVKPENPKLSGRTDVLRDYWEVEKSGGGHERDGDASGCLDEECLDIAGLEYPVGELTAGEAAALRAALDEEYRSLAVYDAAVSRHGRIRPFAMIVRAEERHVALIKGLFDKYGLEIPDNKYAGNVQPRETVTEACSAAVKMEEDSATLYRDELLPTVSSRSDIHRAFSLVSSASEMRHLPAFRECVD